MRIEYILIALAFVTAIVEAVVLYRLSKENKRLETENEKLSVKCYYLQQKVNFREWLEVNCSVESRFRGGK